MMNHLVVGDVRILIVKMRILILVLARLGEFLWFLWRVMVGHDVPLESAGIFVGAETFLGATAQALPQAYYTINSPPARVQQKIRNQERTCLRLALASAFKR